MQVTTLGKLLVEDALPEGVSSTVFDKKGSRAFFKDLAENHPEEYKDTSFKLMNIAKDVAGSYGGPTSLRLRDFRPNAAIVAYRDTIKKHVHAITQSDITPKEKNEKIVKYLRGKMDEIREVVTTESSKDDSNGLAMAIKHGFRGNPDQLRQLLFGDVLVADSQGRAVPVAGLNGYGEGVSPMEYWAGTFASRKGYCLAEDTLVRMADHSSKAIQDIEPGEWVMGATSSGGTLPVKVVNRWDNGKKDVRVYSFYNEALGKGGRDSVVVCTPEHKFLTSSGDKKHIGYIQEGTHLQNGWVVGESIHSLDHIDNTYDLEVDHPDHLFVLDSGLIVSNSDVQFMTAKAGFLGKQLSLAASSVEVTSKDCGATTQGVISPGSSENVLGSVLSRDAYGLSAGTVLDKSNVAKVQGKDILVRNITTCQQETGVCQKCAGMQDKNIFPPIGSKIGNDSGRLMSEPVTQLGLSSKHSGGIMAGKQFSDELTGFDEINQFVQMPKMFQGGAVLANKDGKITSIREAPQGGHYISIDGNEPFYASRSRSIEAKVGDVVEEGDVLTDGTPNPAEIVKYKGLGGGRRYFAKKYAEITSRNGISAKQKHLDILARGFFDKVRITSTEGVGEHLVGDIVPYGRLQKMYKPREGFITTKANKALGQYLEAPTLHYTIGTRITPSVAKTLSSAGIQDISVHRDPPAFEPAAIRIMDITTNDSNWKNRLPGFNLKKGILTAAQRGMYDRPDDAGFVSDVIDPHKLK